MSETVVTEVVLPEPAAAAAAPAAAPAPVAEEAPPPPVPEPAPQAVNEAVPELPTAGEPVIGAPVAPIVLGTDAPTELPRKRGWWRR
jgi:hypothetical protein